MQVLGLHMAFVKLEFRGSTILSSHFWVLFTLLAGFLGTGLRYLFQSLQQT